jgi:hypothetical protein
MSSAELIKLLLLLLLLLFGNVRVVAPLRVAAAPPTPGIPVPGFRSSAVDLKVKNGMVKSRTLSRSRDTANGAAAMSASYSDAIIIILRI